MTLITAPQSVTLSLRPRARLLRTIGDELISSEMVAVIELVKNAYDAEATFVLVRFQEPLEVGKGMIEVIDNGNGMSLDIIKNAWMEPATLLKKRNKKSPTLSRRLLGEKGVGRFATSKLADFLEIVSCHKGSAREVRAIFDWKQFDDEQKYLDEVEVLWDETEPVEFGSEGVIQDLQYLLETGRFEGEITHGTILRMSDLRVSWDREQFKTLRTGLARLVSPFMEMGDFNVYLELPNIYEGLSGRVESPDMLKKPHYSITGDIKEDGTAELLLKVKSKEDIRISCSLVQDGHSPICGPFKIDLRVWDRDTKSLKLMLEDQQSTLKDIRQDLDEVAGVNIYRDNFRVLPYGEKDNDWLRLDLRRVQNPTLRLSNNQIVGYVLISADSNSELRDQSNREGLMEGHAFNDLRKLVKEILAKLETERYDVRREPDSETSSSQPGNLFGGFNIDSIRSVAMKKYGADKELMTVIKSQEKQLTERVEAVKEVLARYQRLASLGQLIDTILHDGRAPLSKIDSEALLGIRSIERPNDEDSLFQRLGKRFDIIKKQALLIGSLFNKIEPFGGRKRGRPVSLILEMAIADAFSILDSELKRADIKIELPRTETQVFVESSEIQQVILNLVENSLHWLKTLPKETRKICVSVSRLNEQNSGSIEILFSDSGPGIQSEFRERIFEPYFSTKPDGIGLGLAIAGEIVTEYYGGSLELVENGPLPGATFSIKLNKRV
jgi:signal transduction histidine kinase